MNILHDITAAHVAPSPLTLGGTRAQLHLEPAPGVFVHVSLTPDLLVFTHGPQQFAFGISDLLAAARAYEPMLGRAALPEPPTQTVS